MIEGKVYGIVSAKGGVGKTTVAANLGAILSKEFKKKVLAVDTNIEVPNLHLYLNMLHLPSTILDLLAGEVTLQHCTYTHGSGLNIICGSFSERNVDLSSLENLVNILKQRYEIIFLDSHPHIDLETRAVMEASDELIIVTNPWLPIVTSNLLTIRLAKKLGVPIRGTILNKTKRSREEMRTKEVEDSLRIPVLGEIPADINVYRGVERRTLVVIEKPRAPSSKAFRKLAKKFIISPRSSQIISRITLVNV